MIKSVGRSLTSRDLCFLVAFCAGMGGAAQGVTTQTFQDPPNEFRLIQYNLNSQALKDYPQWGVGGYMGFFYKNLYKQGPQGPGTIGPVVDAAYKSGSPVWLADDWGYPSGMAGGRVVAENPDFEVRSLVMLVQKGTGAKALNFSLPSVSLFCADHNALRG